MKFLLMSDLHLRDSNPRYRIDDFRTAQFKKLEWCLKLAQKHNASILQAGDCFDSVRASNSLISDTISLLKKYDVPVFTISGNHDQRFATSDLSNTPIQVLDSAHAACLIHEPIILNNIHIYGCHWGQEIPEIKDKNAFNILVIHKMVIPSTEEKIWFGQSNYVTSRVLLAKNKFDVILSGDNHKTFTDTYQNRALFNLGSICRTTIAQVDHKPTVAIYDTETRSHKLFEIPIEPAEIVFNIAEAEKNKKHKEESDRIREYVDILGGDVENREWNFVENLDNFMKVNSVRGSVSEIIKSTLVV